MQRPTSHRRSHAPRARSGAALFAAVLAVAMLIALLGLTALQNFDSERRASAAAVDAAAARRNARSAVELALQDVWSDSSWRTRYTHNAETTALAFESGTLSWRLRDLTDSSLSDDANDPFEIVGIGRVGSAAWVHTVTVQPVEREVGPIELRAYTDLTDLSSDVVTSTKSWAQYFRPYLPAKASSWRVTAVDFYAQQDGTVAGSTTVALSLPLSSFKPGSTLIDQASVAENALGASMAFRRVDFTAAASLDPATGLCIAFTTSAGTPMRLAIDVGGTDAQNTRLVDGNPFWQNTWSNSSLVYRVTGFYRIRELQVLGGSWKRAPLP